jgi:hypothetical protein
MIENEMLHARAPSVLFYAVRRGERRGDFGQFVTGGCKEMSRFGKRGGGKSAGGSWRNSPSAPPFAFALRPFVPLCLRAFVPTSSYHRAPFNGGRAT